MTVVTSPRQPPQILVGRARELELLSRCLDQVRAGQGATVIVGGEAGVGKTALVRQLDGLSLSLIGHCYEFSAAPPYGPWLEILDELRLRGLLHDPDHHVIRHVIESSAQDQHEIFTRIFQTLSDIAIRQPLALILEDMHWADNASIELLQLMSRRVHPHPILMVVTYRDDDLDRSKPLHRILPNLLRDSGAERLHLQRLSQHDTIEIVARRYDLETGDSARLGKYLQTRAQGNPFFTIELLYALEEQLLLSREDGGWRLADLDGADARQPLPDLVRQVIDSRLEQLGSLPRRLLEVAAVLGQDIPIDLWRTLSTVSEEEFSSGVRRAMEGHFIQETDTGRSVTFSHALVREALYLSVVLPQRQRLHQLAAEALLRHPEPDADRVAYHFARAMDPRAVEWLARAGERALSVCAPQTAIEHCDQALELASELATDVPLGIFRTRGSAYSMTGRFLRAQQDFTAVLERARAGGDRRSEWQALQDLGQLWAAKNYARTREYFDAALELARTLGDHQLIAHSLNRVGNWFLNDDRPAEAMRFHHEALEIFKRSGDLLAVAQTTDLLGMDHLIRGDLVTAEQVLSKAIADFEALGDQVGLCSALSTYIITAGSLGFDHEIPSRVAMATVADTMSRALTLARETHWRAGEASVTCIIGSYHAVHGQYDLAMEWMQQAIAIAEEIEHREWASYALDSMSDVYRNLFDLDRARHYSERALELAIMGGSRIHEGSARSSLAAIGLALGDIDGALQMLDSSGSLTRPMGSAHERAACLWTAMAMLRAGNAERALEIVDLVMSTTLPPNQKRVSPWSAKVKGEALVSLGHYPEAEVTLLVARDAALEFMYQPELARIWISLGNLYTHWSRPRDASRSYAEARSVIESLARSVPDPALRDHFLNEALKMIPGTRGLTPFQAARLEAGGLTPRQRDVAVLVAQGLSNRAIADTLSISERTVEGHVSAIMTAMNFSSRAQIAAWAVGQGLARPGAGA